MNRTSKMIAVSLSLLCVHFGYAQNSTSGSNAPACPPKECPKPCAPKPCPPKPCAPAPCPPKPCKPCPPVCFERGYPDTNCCIQSAYNEPANFELSPCPWDFWVDASFTYWTAYEEGLELAVSDASYASLLTVEQFNPYFQDTEWKPGFKVGLGVNLGHDHWSGYAEYTWFRSSATTSIGTPEAPAGATDPNLVIAHWSLESTPNASSLSSKWRVNMDLLDVALTRPYYQGTHLIVAPFGGVRATWIRQNLRIAPSPFSLDPDVLNTNAVLHNKSNSWAIGPRGGFQGKWHLGWGFRVEGDCAASISFTRYTTVASSADPLNFTVENIPSATRFTDYNTIRFNNDMSLGLGWGDYFDCRNYHFDLLVAYDFQIFWNQNMMRKAVDALALFNDQPANNLYLQGLTVRAQFDF